MIVATLGLLGMLPILFWIPSSLSADQAIVFLMGTWLPTTAPLLGWFATRKAKAWLTAISVIGLLVLSLPAGMILVFKSLGPQHNPGVGVAAMPLLFVWMAAIATAIGTPLMWLMRTLR
jgi:hypothetical protein